jgi:hypothetical protein
MKVKDLIEAIERGKEYPDFLEWEVAVETPLEVDVNMESGMLKDGEGWQYCKCHGFNTYMLKEKVFTVNIHY